LIAPDFATGTRREWTQRYTVEQEPKGNFSMAAFVPAGLPSLSAADNKPCDGATQVRQSVPQMSQQEVIEAAQEHAAQTVTAHLAEQEKMKSDITRFGIIAISASKQVKANSGNWELEVRTAPSPVNQGLYDINVQVIRKDVAGTAQEVPFSDTEAQSPWEVRRATLSDLGKVVVVCLSGRSPGRPTPLRLRHEYRVIVPQTASVSSAASAIFMLDGVPTLTSLPNPTAPCQ
jgi:hypothetical protein